MKKHPELCKINLCEHFLSLETLAVGGLTHTKSNMKNEQKLPPAAEHTRCNALYAITEWTLDDMDACSWRIYGDNQ